MRDAFPEFYRPTADDERRFIAEGTVVVDANVLLALYELSVVQRNEALEALEKIGDRLWIPYQVGLEYQRNRLGVIQRQAKRYTRLVDLHGVRGIDALIDALSGITLPDEVAVEVRPHLDQLAQRLSEATADYVTAATEIRDRHVVTAEQGLDDDPVRKRLDGLFATRVGQRPDDKTSKARVDEASRRRKLEIPPGYKDDQKGSDERNAGDYLLWIELLEHARSAADDGRPFLLVTNDVKEDWYAKSGGEPTGPRPELVREFNTYSSNGYHQVTLEGMLRLARRHLSVHIGDATIEKASELSRPDYFYADESARRLEIGDPERHAKESRVSVALDRQMAMDLLVDMLRLELLAGESDSDVALARQHLKMALTRELYEFSRARWRASWSKTELWVWASRALHDAVRGCLPSSPGDWSDSLESAAVDMFVHLAGSYRRYGMPNPDEDR